MCRYYERKRLVTFLSRRLLCCVVPSQQVCVWRPTWHQEHTSWCWRTASMTFSSFALIARPLSSPSVEEDVCSLGLLLPLSLLRQLDPEDLNAWKSWSVFSSLLLLFTSQSSLFNCLPGLQQHYTNSLTWLLLNNWCMQVFGWERTSSRGSGQTRTFLSRRLTHQRSPITGHSRVNRTGCRMHTTNTKVPVRTGETQPLCDLAALLRRPAANMLLAASC